MCSGLFFSKERVGCYAENEEALYIVSFKNPNFVITPKRSSGAKNGRSTSAPLLQCNLFSENLALIELFTSFTK